VKAAVMKEVRFPSASRANVTYTARLYSDGSSSCNCKGWTRRVAVDGSRECKHTRQLAEDYNCRARTDPTHTAPVITAQPKAYVPPLPVKQQPKVQQETIVESPRRRFNWDD